MLQYLFKTDCGVPQLESRCSPLRQHDIFTGSRFTGRCLVVCLHCSAAQTRSEWSVFPTFPEASQWNQLVHTWIMVKFLMAWKCKYFWTKMLTTNTLIAPFFWLRFSDLTCSCRSRRFPALSTMKLSHSDIVPSFSLFTHWIFSVTASRWYRAT